MDASVKIAVSNILEEASRQQGEQPRQEFVEALNASVELSKEQLDEVRLSVVQSLSKIKSASGAGFIGIWLGGAVENGANPEAHIPSLLTHFVYLMKQLAIVDDEAEDSPENNEVKTGLQYLGQSLVAHLSRSDKYRKEVASDDETMVLIDDIANYSVGANWVYELLEKHSDELIVLHAEEAIGVRVKYKNLSNCFHLFTLLQKTLADIMPHEVEEEDDEEDEGFSDYAWWHYGQGNHPEASIVSSIFGDMSPRGISVIDEQQVLILWPMIMASRSWDDGFFHPVLEAAPAGIELLEVLSNEDVVKWRKRLQLNNE